MEDRLLGDANLGMSFLPVFPRQVLSQTLIILALLILTPTQAKHRQRKDLQSSRRPASPKHRVQQLPRHLLRRLRRFRHPHDHRHARCETTYLAYVALLSFRLFPSIPLV